MSDPAIEAAQRAWASYVRIGGHPWSDPNAAAISAAREMAKSVQELHVPVLQADHAEGIWKERCKAGCTGAFPCETAKRVYPTEEL